MILSFKKNDFYILLLLSAIVFIIVALRSVFVPFTHDEVATFYYYIQSQNFLPFYAHIDANNHVLNSATASLFYCLFGEHPFILRIPNLIGLALLITGTFRICNFINNRLLKFLTFSLILFSFHWISFFSTCRGYGISMGLLLLSFTYFLHYIQNVNNIKQYILFSIFIQLALSANLTLFFLAVLFFLYIVYQQVINRKLLNYYNILILVINLLIIAFWLKYIMLLKESNAFYLGKGDSYWVVTFLSVIEIITGTKNLIINNIIALLCILLLILSAYKLKIYNLKQINLKFNHPLFAVFFFIISLIISFFLLKLFLNVNYPQERAALFFYLLFVLLIVFCLDTYNSKLVNLLSYILIAAFILHFTFNLNFKKHSIEEYVSIPQRFYNILLSEQQKSNTQITIGGSNDSEFIYGFLNYRNGGKLNLIDPAKKMTMNCDYYIAQMCDSPFYKPYYSEIIHEPDWGFALLKRKEKIEREVIWTSKKAIEINCEDEFVNIFKFNDTTLTNTQPILVELNFDVISSPVPNLSWFVLDINDFNEENNIYKRIPLNWLKSDWNNSKNNRYCFVTDKLPKKIKKMIFYYWNSNKEYSKITISKVVIYKLIGKGLDYSI